MQETCKIPPPQPPPHGMPKMMMNKKWRCIINLLVVSGADFIHVFIEGDDDVSQKGEEEDEENVE